MELSLEHQKELRRLENELNKHYFDLETTHRLTLEMEQFLRPWIRGYGRRV